MEDREAHLELAEKDRVLEEALLGRLGDEESYKSSVMGRLRDLASRVAYLERTRDEFRKAIRWAVGIAIATAIAALVDGFLRH